MTRETSTQQEVLEWVILASVFSKATSHFSLVKIRLGYKSQSTVLKNDVMCQ